VAPLVERRRARVQPASPNLGSKHSQDFGSPFPLSAALRTCFRVVKRDLAPDGLASAALGSRASREGWPGHRWNAACRQGREGDLLMPRLGRCAPTCRNTGPGSAPRRERSQLSAMPERPDAASLVDTLPCSLLSDSRAPPCCEGGLARGPADAFTRARTATSVGSTPSSKSSRTPTSGPCSGAVGHPEVSTGTHCHRPGCLQVNRCDPLSRHVGRFGSTGSTPRPPQGPGTGN